MTHIATYVHMKSTITYLFDDNGLELLMLPLLLDMTYIGVRIIYAIIS